MKKIIFIILGIALITPSYSTPVAAQASLNLDAIENMDVYQGIETLIGFGLIPKALQTQKPWSAHEVQSYLDAAKTHLIHLCEKQKLQNCRETQEGLQVKIESLEKKIKRLLPKPNRNWAILPAELQTHFYYLDSPTVAAPVSNGIGHIDAQINPFTNFFAGRHFVDGTQYSWELNHGLELTPYFLAFAHYRFENLFPTTAADDTNIVLHKAYGKLQYKNFSLQVGRDSLNWGQGESGGLALSNHARPFDMLVFSSDKPFLLPWFFKVLHEVNVAAFIAHLGPESYFPNGLLTGYKVSWKPFRVWELSVTNLSMFGGEGAPTTTFFDYLGDIAGYSGTQNSISNRIWGLDSAITLPFLRYTRLYGEIFFDDKSLSNLKSTLMDSAAYTAGIFVPRLNNSGSLQWRLEGTYTSQLFYRHWQFRDGMTLNHLLIGDPLGPDGYRAMSKWYWQTSPSLVLDFATTVEGRDSNTYRNSTARREVTQDNPTDKRFRNVLHARKNWNNTISSDFYLGFEHAFDFAYQDGAEENNYFLGLSTRFALWR